MMRRGSIPVDAGCHNSIPRCQTVCVCLRFADAVPPGATFPRGYPLRGRVTARLSTALRTLLDGNVCAVHFLT
eukprot:5458969-Pleurochrysis_carterae.AAC.1